jgi:ATP-binding cassette subfamily C protein LapB
MQPMTQLASLMTRFQQAMAAFQSVQSLMQLPQERDLEQPPLHRPALQAAIRLREVDFTYPNHPFPTLSAIDLNIQPGERVGIIGPTGSGKSTLAKLVCKFYSPNQGSVLVGGTDLRQVDPGDLRRQVSFLAQDAPLISGSVRDNIKFGQATLSDEAIVAAAEVSGIATYLNEHPEGFDLQVGEQGRQLSGGQKQAIALARALSNNANIVILDEPSNALDGQAEQSLIQSLSTYLSHRTLMLITHRTSMLALVDRLVVMRSGRIVLDGPKTEILQQLSKQPQAVR